MKYSLINVYSEHDGKIQGAWIQDHTGTLESAKEAARTTEAVNSNRITVAVVADAPGGCPPYDILTNLERLA